MARTEADTSSERHPTGSQIAMEPDLGSAIEPNANRRPRRATRFNTGIATPRTRSPARSRDGRLPWPYPPWPLKAWRGASSGHGASEFSVASRSLATVAETLGSRPLRKPRSARAWCPRSWQTSSAGVRPTAVAASSTCRGVCAWSLSSRGYCQRGSAIARNADMAGRAARVMVGIVRARWRAKGFS